MMSLIGRCEPSKEISLSKAAKILSKFVSAEDNGAPNYINKLLHDASKGFNELNRLHKELKPSQSHRKSRNVDGKLNQNDVKFNQEVNGLEKKISNNAKVESRGLVAPRDVEVRSKRRNEAVSEVKMQRGKNSEVENAEGQEQQKEVEKKPSTGVKSGGPMGSRLYAAEKSKKRKNQDGEERIESRSGEHSKKKMKH